MKDKTPALMPCHCRSEALGIQTLRVQIIMSLVLCKGSQQYQSVHPVVVVVAIAAQRNELSIFNFIVHF